MDEINYDDNMRKANLEEANGALDEL